MQHAAAAPAGGRARWPQHRAARRPDPVSSSAPGPSTRCCRRCCCCTACRAARPTTLLEQRRGRRRGRGAWRGRHGGRVQHALPAVPGAAGGSQPARLEDRPAHAGGAGGPARVAAAQPRHAAVGHRHLQPVRSRGAGQRPQQRLLQLVCAVCAARVRAFARPHGATAAAAHLDRAYVYTRWVLFRLPVIEYKVCSSRNTPTASRWWLQPCCVMLQPCLNLAATASQARIASFCCCSQQTCAAATCCGLAHNTPHHPYHMPGLWRLPGVAVRPACPACPADRPGCVARSSRQERRSHAAAVQQVRGHSSPAQQGHSTRPPACCLSSAAAARAAPCPRPCCCRRRTCCPLHAQADLGRALAVLGAAGGVPRRLPRPPRRQLQLQLASLAKPHADMAHGSGCGLPAAWRRQWRPMPLRCRQH